MQVPTAPRGALATGRITSPHTIKTQPPPTKKAGPKAGFLAFQMSVVKRSDASHSVSNAYSRDRSLTNILPLANVGVL